MIIYTHLPLMQIFASFFLLLDSSQSTAWGHSRRLIMTQWLLSGLDEGQDKLETELPCPKLFFFKKEILFIIYLKLFNWQITLLVLGVQHNEIWIYYEIITTISLVAIHHHTVPNFYFLWWEFLRFTLCNCQICSVYVCVLNRFSCVWLCATWWTVTHQFHGILQARILE